MFHTMIRPTPGLHPVLRNAPDLSIEPSRTSVLTTATLPDTYVPMTVAWFLAATRRSSPSEPRLCRHKRSSRAPRFGRSRHRYTRRGPPRRRRGFRLPHLASLAMLDRSGRPPAWTRQGRGLTLRGLQETWTDSSASLLFEISLILPDADSYYGYAAGQRARLRRPSSKLDLLWFGRH